MVAIMNKLLLISCKIPVVLLLSGALLSACAQVGRGVQRIGGNIHEQTVDYDRRLSKALTTEDAEFEKERKRQPDTAYCYRTLGDITCYRHPMAGAQMRLVGKQLPEPMFNEFTYPVPDEKPEAVYIEMATSEPETNGVVAPPTAVQMKPLPAAGENEAPMELMPQLGR